MPDLHSPAPRQRAIASIASAARTRAPAVASGAGLPWGGAGLAAFLTGLLALADPAGATTHLVRPDGGGDFPSIQAALTAAATGDTILLADGVFLGDGNRDLDPAGKALVVRAQSGQADACIIDCEGSAENRHRGFDFRSAEGRGTVVEDITIRNGWGPDDPYGLAEAGAILCQDASPTLRRCIFANNQASFGGAILLYGISAPAINGCSFTGNYASLDCAGINCRENTAPLVTGCSFTGNTAGSRAGGFLADDDSAPEVRGCTFLGNQAGNGGGGIYTCGGSTPHFAGCTLVGNGGGSGGGGISCACHADVLVERTIIAYSTSGQGVLFVNDAYVTLNCCDIYDNAGGDWVPPIAGQYGINGNFAADPFFCDPGAGDLRLDGESPCLPRNHPWGDECGVIGAWGVGCPGTGVEESSSSAGGLWLGPPCPNPSAAGATLRFSVADEQRGTAGENGSVTLRIHDAAGRTVRTLVVRSLEPGNHVVFWDGCDDAGAFVPAGAYWCRLEYGGRSIARPMLRVR
jgi:hypothetical protein